MAVAKRSIQRFSRENLSDTAAALTYYAVLSIFPAMIVVVALVGLVGRYPETTDRILRMVAELGPDTAVETFRDPVESVVRNKGGAGALLGVGLLAALWSASGYVGPSCAPRTRSTRFPRTAGCTGSSRSASASRC